MSGRDGPRPRRLIDRLVAATLLAGVAAAVLGAFLLQRSSRSATSNDARERARVLAEQYAVRFDDRVDDLVQDLEIVATRSEISALEPASAIELRVVLRTSKVFDELVLYDVEGRARAAAASRFLADPSEVEPEPGLAAAVAQAGQRVELVGDEAPVLRVAVAVQDPPGRTVGVLTGNAPLDLVGAVLEEVVAPGQPVPLLVSEEGRVLLHRDRDRVVKQEKFPLDAVLGAARGATVVDVSGERRIAAAVESGRLDAAVVVEQPQDEALAPVDERRRELVLILTATIVATVAAVIVAGEVLLRPLRPLTEAVARVGRGDVGVRTGVTGRGEIGRLAHEVDRMSEALDQRDEQLAQLQQLSLLVGSIAERSTVAPRILSGAVRLVRAEGAALLPPDPSSLDTPVVAGVVSPPADLEDIAGAARRTGGPVARPSPVGSHLLAVPLTSAEDAPLGTLVAVRRTEPFAASDGELLTAFAAFAAVAIDNARRLELQSSLADQLQATVDRRRDVIGTVTHEFRTPLACIEGFASSLVDGWAQYDDDERLELVGRIAHHAEEMEELVARFLDYSVTERGGVVAHLEPVALRPVVDQVVEVLAPLLAERELSVDVPELTVHADATLLRRTLTNLLSNAVKYSPQGAPVAIAAESDGTRVRIDVTDQGQGMSANEAAQAFEPFWRGGGSSTRTARGTGLGLALVSEYSRAMDGSCGVTSEVGHGSTFFVSLRLASVPATGLGGQVGGT